jgi:hypothetical protein
MQCRQPNTVVRHRRYLSRKQIVVGYRFLFDFLHDVLVIDQHLEAVRGLLGFIEANGLDGLKLGSRWN